MSALLVVGTSSWAGKSMLTAALCASLRRRGVDVAPFKAMNMAINARVVAGGEIGAAQYFQARAAGVTPSVAHNPVLIKPEAHTRSQVVLNGQVDRALSRTPWRERAEKLWPAVREAYDTLAARHDVVVIEGAGSPAEINLASIDLANLAIGRHAYAPMLLVTDIDRGGAFAHLYGTWALLEPQDQQRVKGFVLNKFRGDSALLAPGPQIIEQRTGVPTLGVVPMVDHGLPDEDGADPRPSGNDGIRVRVVRAPGASNLDEWWPLRETSDFRWAFSAGDIADAQLIVLPGSKTTVADLTWMRSLGIDTALAKAHSEGVPILAVCGGAQILGKSIDDPHDVEGGGYHDGLGLLPHRTVLQPSKTITATRVALPQLPAPWDSLGGIEVEGYEIHHGDSGFGTTSAYGPVLATYLHGLAENPSVVRALTGRTPKRGLSDVFDGLADLVDEHLDMDTVLALM